MMGTYIIAAVALVLVGATGGFMIVISLASHQDKDLISPTSDRIKRGARVANGLHVRWPTVPREGAYQHDLRESTNLDWRES